jgi:hypothetical protein
MKKIMYSFAVCCMMHTAIHAQDWHILGNAGTTPGTHFLGTTDTKALMFKVNNQKSGYIDYNAFIANTSFGHKALFSNTSGAYNTASGYQALYSNNTGRSNTAYGYQALYSNTSGFYNTASGLFALYSNTTSNANTASGYRALYSNSTGSSNTASGNNAMSSNTTGNYNTAFGTFAGSSNDNNTYCTFVGFDADQDVTTDFFNSMALGHDSRIDASNQVRIGNSFITSIGGYVGWTDLPSDARFKKNIKDNVPGLIFINQLQPITYTVDVPKLRKFLGEDKNVEDGDNTTAFQQNNSTIATIQKGIADKEMIVRTGFIAQQVEAAAKKIDYNFSGVDRPKDNTGMYGLRYAEFVVPLVKSVQELSQQNEKLQKKNDDLQKQIDELKAMVLNSTANNSSLQQRDKIMLTQAVLENNVPNPFAHTTRIFYTLPRSFSKAQLSITDKSGKMIKVVPLSGTGRGSVEVDASALASGAYSYSLYVDGKWIATKEMLLVKGN